MSDFYRVACGDNAVWFDNERDATQYFRDRARDDEQDGILERRIQLLKW